MCGLKQYKTEKEAFLCMLSRANQLFGRFGKVKGYAIKRIEKASLSTCKYLQLATEDKYL